MLRFALSLLLAVFALSIIASGLRTAGAAEPSPQETDFSAILQSAGSDENLARLRAIVVARNGSIVAERGYRGHAAADSANIKSASKSIISALVGIAIDKGLLEGVDQPIAPILHAELPDDPDPRLERVTIGHLLSMQAGLERTSGGNYGRWVASRNWVRAALAMPFVDEPGGAMLYSTGSTHLLSAILTKVGGKSTLALARDWLGPLEDFRIGAWDRDPQGIYLGGNQMAMSARSLLAFGELYRRGGRTPDGTQLVSEEWVRQSWQVRTNSRFSNDGYGYGWFERMIGGKTVHFAWGFGGQMLYIVPELGLTVAMTSDESGPSARNGYRDDLHGVLAKIIGTVES
ncbi:beta-lactamase family protein [Rhizobium sp. TRM95111]|uniref:serine hydrolase domain-containing protein n=1 Tax=Rhizobium alarense TaxID=2846851 RepID=UPI001F32E949|nr:serine hydrolase [Rhizobium alarense]MCF3642256.1 beta-lactamase family protein [Rhizobium alarense]